MVVIAKEILHAIARYYSYSRPALYPHVTNLEIS